MPHSIIFVDDDALPPGHDFLFVELSFGPRIFYRRSAITESNLEDSWAAYRALQRHPPVEPTSAPPSQGVGPDGRYDPRTLAVVGWRLCVA